MIPVAEARAFVLSACGTLSPRPVALSDASGHVLAETIRAVEAVPPFANSAMDGYAVRADDTACTPARLRVVGSVMAGDDAKTFVSAGESVRIMTGAPLPPGADAVCMVERTHVEAGGSIVIIDESVNPGTNIRNAGDDVAVGEEVFGPGTFLGPAHLGVLSSLGVGDCSSTPLPRWASSPPVTSSSRPWAELAPGKIRDSNRPALLAELGVDGFGALDLGMAGDDEANLADLLGDAACRCDAVVTSGGVSVGDRDVLKVVLKKLSGATMRSMQVAVKPAKPFAFGVLEASGTPVFGFPGTLSLYSSPTSCSSGRRFAPWPATPCSIEPASPPSLMSTSPVPGRQVAFDAGDGTPRSRRGAPGEDVGRTGLSHAARHGSVQRPRSAARRGRRALR